MPRCAAQPVERPPDAAGSRQQSLPVEIYHDAAQALADIQTEFAHGLVSLVERAQAEEVHNCIGLLLQQRLNPGNRVHRALLDELNEKLARKLFVNFSMFQSLPDVWGIDQIFPILPLEGLHRPPTRRALVRDMTCDSDGRIDHYVDGDGIEATLPLPEGEDTKLLAFFLTGAYQEILGICTTSLVTPTPWTSGLMIGAPPGNPHGPGTDPGECSGAGQLPPAAPARAAFRTTR